MKYIAIIFGVILVIECGILLKSERDIFQIGDTNLKSIYHNEDNKLFRTIFLKLLKSINKEPKELDFNILGDFLINFGYCEEAAAVFQYTTDHYPQSYSAHLGLAVCTEQLGYLEHAAAAYQRAHALASNQAQRNECKHRIGKIYLKQNAIDQAQACFASLDYAPSHVDLCRIYVYQGKFAEAKQLFDKLMIDDPRDQSMEVYQLNALAKRHFGEAFGVVPLSNNRELIYSMHIPLESSKVLTEKLFSLRTYDLYKNEMEQMPELYYQAPSFSNEDLLKASYNAERVQSGQTLYAQHNCAVCHGPDAYGSTGPNLRDDFWIIPNMSMVKIHVNITLGRAQNTMPGYKFILDPYQIRDLSAYLIDLNRSTKKQPNGHTVNGKEAQGTLQALFSK